MQFRILRARTRDGWVERSDTESFCFSAPRRPNVRVLFPGDDSFFQWMGRVSGRYTHALVPGSCGENIGDARDQQFRKIRANWTPCQSIVEASELCSLNGRMNLGLTNA